MGGGKDCTVIDYVIDEEVRGRIKRMRIGDRIDSDHHPVEVWIEGRVERRKREERRERAGRMICDGEGREMFRKKIELGRAVGEAVEEAGGIWN